MTHAHTETVARRLARRQGLKLERSRSRTPSDPTYGGYMLVDVATGVVVAGGSPVPYFLSLDDVAAYLRDQPA